MNSGRWQHFPHSADIGIKGTGATLAEAFEQAALALFAAVTDLDGVASSTRVQISCQAPSNEILLVDWLNALIYETSVRKMLFSRFKVEIAGHRLNAYAWGESIDRGRHVLAVEPKGATFTELKVNRAGDGSWDAQCVIDV
jgi:SHS2 domain-containing protein